MLRVRTRAAASLTLVTAISLLAACDSATVRSDAAGDCEAAAAQIQRCLGGTSAPEGFMDSCLKAPAGAAVLINSSCDTVKLAWEQALTPSNDDKADGGGGVGGYVGPTPWSPESWCNLYPVLCGQYTVTEGNTDRPTQQPTTSGGFVAGGQGELCRQAQQQCAGGGYIPPTTGTLCGNVLADKPNYLQDDYQACGNNGQVCNVNPTIPLGPNGNPQQICQPIGRVGSYCTAIVFDSYGQPVQNDEDCEPWLRCAPLGAQSPLGPYVGTCQYRSCTSDAECASGGYNTVCRPNRNMQGNYCIWKGVPGDQYTGDLCLRNKDCVTNVCYRPNGNTAIGYCVNYTPWTPGGGGTVVTGGWGQTYQGEVLPPAEGIVTGGGSNVVIIGGGYNDGYTGGGFTPGGSIYTGGNSTYTQPPARPPTLVFGSGGDTVTNPPTPRYTTTCTPQRGVYGSYCVQQGGQSEAAICGAGMVCRPTSGHAQFSCGDVYYCLNPGRNGDRCGSNSDCTSGFICNDIPGNPHRGTCRPSC
jgi:hypothetical protein